MVKIGVFPHPSVLPPPTSNGSNSKAPPSRFTVTSLHTAVGSGASQVCHPTTGAEVVLGPTGTQCSLFVKPKALAVQASAKGTKLSTACPPLITNKYSKQPAEV